MIDISQVTSQGPHTSSTRSTKYEWSGSRQVGPNSLPVACVERGVVGSPIEIDIDESVLSQPVRLTIGGTTLDVGGMELVHAFMSFVEEAFRTVHDAKEAELKLAGIDIPRAEVQKLVRAAEDAKAAKAATDAAIAAAQLEQARIEAENIVKRAEIEQLDADLATMRAAVAEPAQAEKTP